VLVFLVIAKADMHPMKTDYCRGVPDSGDAGGVGAVAAGEVPDGGKMCHAETLSQQIDSMMAAYSHTENRGWL